MTNSLRFLLAMIDPASIAASDNPSLLMVKLQLEGTDLFYDPPLDVVKANVTPGNDTISIMDRVNSWISDFYNVVKLVKRLDRQVTLTLTPAPTLTLTLTLRPQP